jgi:transcription elongation factor Elf1
MLAERRRKMPKWAGVLLVIAFVICIPLWIPALIVWNGVRKHRLRKAANAFTCVNCGATLGVDALARADREWGNQMRELMRQHPGVRFRILRTLHAICSGCGTRYTFHENERTFVVEDPLPV